MSNAGHHGSLKKISSYSLGKSISFKIMFVLIVTILFIMAGWGTYYYFLERSKAMRQFEIAAGKIADHAAREKRNSPVAMLDGLESELGERDILAIGVNVRSGTGEKYVAVMKNGGVTGYGSGEEFMKSAPGVFAQKPLVVRSEFRYPEGSGTVELFVTERFINADFNNFILRLIGLACVLSFFVVFILFVSLRKIILKPILDLDRVVQRFNDKDFSVRAAVSSDDEVGKLSRNFNVMADSIEVYRQEITRQLFIDPLTGLPNRKKIMAEIEGTKNPSLILMNVDSFKEINDFYGNKIGDAVLKEIAGRLKYYEKEYDYRLYRMNGDEYALLFDRVIKQEEMDSMLKNLTTELNDRPYNINDNDVSVRLTAGIALGQDVKVRDDNGAERWTRLATNADMALKKAKHKQKDHLVFDETMEIPKEYESNIFWRQRLREAIREHKIVPFFQPIINNYNGRIEKYESLVRLIDPYGNVITPDYFLEVAKRAHLYSDITKAMIEKAFPVFYGTNYEFSINLTLYDILDEDMNRFIMRKLRDNRDLAKMLVFEILESEGIENYKDVMIFIEEVKDIGCKIAIDDFGSGYSNFEHILRLDVDYIKIDSSLIKNLDKDVNAQIITRTIANFARKLGLKTISEYVHSKEVYEKAVGLGVDYSQGFYFGEPREFILKPKDFLINTPKAKIIDTSDEDIIK